MSSIFPGRLSRATATTLALLLVLVTAAAAPQAGAQTSPPDPAAPAPAAPAETPTTDAEPIGRTPPRLSLIDGQVSFWRPGADEWVAARLNTPLAPGDELYTGRPGSVELQIGGRAWVRAWASTQVGLASLEPDFVQLRMTTGHVSLDLRRLDPGRTVELDTPNAAFTIERPGYYRVIVTENRTSFVSRRGGRATVTTADGAEADIAPSEEVIVEGVETPTMTTYVAPELDAWDRWNYARSDALIDSLSSRYVSADIYGVDDLDHHGTWRVVESYGAVWVPSGAPAGWAPYTTGTWVWDPFYAWTWVDTAPWGWAPYHYGRWVFINGYWAWAPGPVVVRPAYAPALVAFYGHGSPFVGWVALGWGEPLLPWWGYPGFIGVPWWGGWGGPLIVNNVIIVNRRSVRAHDIKRHRNLGEPHAVVTMPRDRFGRAPVTRAQAVQPDPAQMQPVRGRLEVAPSRASLTPAAARGVQPSEAVVRRRVVATREPEAPARWLAPLGLPSPARTEAAQPRLVPAPSRPEPARAAPRPPFGTSGIERSQPVQPPRVPPAAPPLERAQPPGRAIGPQPQAPSRPQAPSAPRAAPQPRATERAAPTPPSVEPRSPAPSIDRPAPQAPSLQQGVPQAPPVQRGVPQPPVQRGVPQAPMPSQPAPAPAPSRPAPAPQGPPAGVAQPPAGAVRPPSPQLPGQPANRLSPGRVPSSSRPSPPAQGPAPSAPSSRGR